MFFVQTTCCRGTGCVSFSFRRYCCFRVRARFQAGVMNSLSSAWFVNSVYCHEMVSQPNTGAIALALRICTFCTFCTFTLHYALRTKFKHPGLYDHPRDHPGRCLYYVGAFWLHLQGHFKFIAQSEMRNVKCMSVKWTLELDNGPGVTSVAKKKSGHHAHANDHGHVRVYARLSHIKRAMLVGCLVSSL